MHSQLYNEVVTIMEKVQKTTSCHQKYRSVLVKLYEKSDTQAFYNCIEKIVAISLQQNPKISNIHAEKAIEFCALFCASPELKVDPKSEEYSLLEKIFYFLLDLHNLESDTVRYRVCQIINKLLNNLTDTELNGDLCNKIEEAMLQRVQEDSKSEIRFQAVSAVYRLQNPDDKDCKIIPVMISHMSGDLSAKVRKVCVQKIAITREVLAALVVRVRDVHNDVRLAAFIRASKLAQYFKITEKHDIIRHGFRDSCEHIKNFVAHQLVPSWLTDYSNDYLKLLQAVRMDTTECYREQTTAIIKHILGALFGARPIEEILEVLPIADNHMLAYEDLNWESVTYWRFLSEMLRKSDRHELYLRRILPDLVDFVKYIRNYYKQKSTDNDGNTVEFQFILKQLFTITQGYDVSDTVSRQALNELVADVLQEVNLDSDVAETVLRNLDKSIAKVEQRNTFVSEIISDIMYPVSNEDAQNSEDTTFKISQIKVQMNCLNETLISAVQKEDFESASKCKAEINQLKECLSDLQAQAKAATVVVKKTDACTIMKCLNIAKGLLISPQVTTLSPILRTLCEETIIEQLMVDDQDNDVRTKALECYALCCIIDNENAKKGVQIFTRYILSSSMEECNAEHLKICIKATVDLLVLYGKSLMNAEESNAETPLISLTDVIQAMVDLMEHEDIEVQLCATHGLCNLIVSCRIQSATLISRMVLKWCNPVSEEEESQGLQQLIGMLLEELPKLPGSADQIEKALLPTIKTLLCAPNTSPLSEVNLQNLVKLLLTLCDMCEEATNLHSNLAISICCEIKDDPTNKFNVVLSKILLMLRLPSDDTQIIKNLITLCDQLRDDIHNRLVLNNIIKFNANLETLKSSLEISTINEEVEE